MTNKDILDYLKWEKENLLRIVGDNKSEFNLGRIYAMDKMIDGVEGVFINNMQQLPIRIVVPATSGNPARPDVSDFLK